MEAGADRLELELANRRATRHMAAALARQLAPGDVVFLEGELGAGKTFFARGVARGMGLPESVPVQSPTFMLVQELPTPVPLVHADLYRLGEAGELEPLGLLESMDGAVTLLEWALPYAEELGADGLIVRLDRKGRERGRGLVMEARGPRGRAILAALRADPALGSLDGPRPRTDRGKKPQGYSPAGGSSGGPAGGSAGVGPGESPADRCSGNLKPR